MRGGATGALFLCYRVIINTTANSNQICDPISRLRLDNLSFAYYILFFKTPRR